MENFTRKPESDPGHGMGVGGDGTERVTRFLTWKIIRIEAEKGNDVGESRESKRDTECGDGMTPCPGSPGGAAMRTGSHGGRGPSKEGEGKSTGKL